jgi:hypothetical protein
MRSGCVSTETMRKEDITTELKIEKGTTWAQASAKVNTLKTR